MQTSNECQLQIRLLTKQNPYAVPDVPLSVPQNIENKSLNDLVNRLLKETNSAYLRDKDFDFLVSGELLRLSLLEHLQERNISTESTVDIEYIERTPAPEPENSLLHDDWVCAVHTVDKWILTGCYDSSVNIWTLHGKPVLSLKEHKNIVKSVSWLDEHDTSKGFVSVSHDSTGIIWSYEPGTDNVQAKAVMRGHERGVDSVGVSPNSERLATGGWDKNLKLWSSSLDDVEGEPAQKKGKSKSDVVTKTPLHTLKGHKEAITGVEWVDNHEACTVSMDHTIKFWDAELCGIKNEIVGQKAFLSLSWSPLSNTLVTSSADSRIRLYDPRSSDGSICKTTFISHKMWVSSVAWSNYNEYLFMSGSYDSAVIMWDTRSPKAPLYNLKGHEDKVLAVNWSNQKFLVSGGADNSVHIFRNKDVN